MSGKFFYLYLIGGFAALALLIYELITASGDVNGRGVLFYIIPTILLFYMAYKTWHVKNDQELM
ncbi:hypothetical protein DYU05_20400 [Mucilaginibacter terrenus]|uniref:Uncharacterized protein n=1 Tax=Mucilaginibacter terrenus TaxID=2482727 RepID=A0A3E2NJM3_9SPHI|nr:hypothetical protein [Mucilaginibacter terrenus]RFZ81123.1 hypothetical protein DYU05_20400 [Mucilaginibacter terrenus]